MCLTDSEMTEHCLNYVQRHEAQKAEFGQKAESLW